MLYKTLLGVLLCFFYLFTINSAFAKSYGSKTIKVCSVKKISSLEKKMRIYNKIIKKYSNKYSVPESLIKAVITAESCFNPRAVSPKGAQGLMQLMPPTAARFGVIDSFDPDDNIRGGTKYLKFLLSHFDQYTKHAVAAYNAGEGAVARYRGVPPYKETINYVAKVTALHRTYSKGVKVSAVFRQGRVKAYRSFVKTRASLSPYKNRQKNYAKSSCFKTSKRLKRATKYLKRGRLKQRVYFARKGDTLMKVMQKTGVNKSKIQLMNNLRSNSRLKRGQKLLLWECR